MQLGIDLDGIPLDKRLAGLVVAFGLDALHLAEHVAEQSAQFFVIVDHDIRFAVFPNHLDHVVGLAALIAPLADQLAVAHMRLLDVFARLDTRQLGHHAVQDIFRIAGLRHVERGHQPQFHRLRVTQVVEAEEVGAGFLERRAVTLQLVALHARRQLSRTVPQTLVQVGMQVVGQFAVLVHHLAVPGTQHELLVEAVAMGGHVVGIGDVVDGDRLRTVLLANPVGAVAVALTALTALTAAAVAFGAVMKDRTSESVKNRKAIEQCKDSYDELKDSMEEHAKERKENIKSAKTEAATYQNLADKLYELADKTNKTASDKAQMNTIVDQLNGAMPELGLSIDETTGALNREKSAVDAVIDSMKQQALANAYQEQANKAASDLAEAQIQLSEAEEVLNDLRSQAVKKINEHNAAVQDGTESVQEMASSYAAAGEPVDKYALQLNALNGQIKEQKEVVAGLQGTTSEADERYNKIAEKAYEYKTAVEESNQGVADSATEMSDEVKQAYEDMKTSIQNNLKGVVNAYEDFSGGEEISAGDVVTHLKSAANGVDQWADNLITLAGRAGEGMTKEFFSYLVDLGPQSANLVKACTEMSKKELQDAVAAYSESGGEAAEAYSEKLAAIITNWDSTGQEIAQAAGRREERQRAHGKSKKRDRIRPEGSHGGGQERRRGSRKSVAESNRGRNPAEFRAGVTGGEQFHPESGRRSTGILQRVL